MHLGVNFILLSILAAGWFSRASSAYCEYFSPPRRINNVDRWYSRPAHTGVIDCAVVSNEWQVERYCLGRSSGRRPRLLGLAEIASLPIRIWSDTGVVSDFKYVLASSRKFRWQYRTSWGITTIEYFMLACPLDEAELSTTPLRMSGADLRHREKASAALSCERNIMNISRGRHYFISVTASGMLDTSIS